MTWLSETVEFHESAFGDETLLICPACGQEYLHQGMVRVYDRSEDAKQTLVTTVFNGAAKEERRLSNLTRNPSSRRHGVVIAFGCEICCAELELTIAQHKGHTLVEWRYQSKETIKPGDEMLDDIGYPALRAEPE